MKITPIKTRIFRPGENLCEFIDKFLKKIEDKDILVVTSKIVSLSEGRVVEVKSEKMRDQIIKAESQYAMRTKYTWLTIKDNTVMSSAGLDQSNGDGKTILLPMDSYKSAEKIRKYFVKKYSLSNLGVLITDSRYLPLRAGIVGVSLGYAGFKGVRDYVGSKDLFGRRINYSRVDVADSLAMGAVLLMGEVDEKMPVSIISGADVVFVKKVNRHELDINVKEDLYQPLFERIKRIKY